MLYSQTPNNPRTGSQLVRRQLWLRLTLTQGGRGHGFILRFPIGESATQDTQVPLRSRPALPYVTSHPADQRLTQQKKGVKKNRRFGLPLLPLAKLHTQKIKVGLEKA